MVAVSSLSPMTVAEKTLLVNYEREELYIIPDGVEDFDKELGKIITMHRMKQQHE